MNTTNPNILRYYTQIFAYKLVQVTQKNEVYELGLENIAKILRQLSRVSKTQNQQVDTYAFTNQSGERLGTWFALLSQVTSQKRALEKIEKILEQMGLPLEENSNSSSTDEGGGIAEVVGIRSKDSPLPIQEQQVPAQSTLYIQRAVPKILIEPPKEDRKRQADSNNNRLEEGEIIEEEEALYKRMRLIAAADELKNYYKIALAQRRLATIINKDSHVQTAIAVENKGSNNESSLKETAKKAIDDAVQQIKTVVISQREKDRKTSHDGKTRSPRTCNRDRGTQSSRTNRQDRGQRHGNEDKDGNMRQRNAKKESENRQNWTCANNTARSRFGRNTFHMSRILDNTGNSRQHGRYRCNTGEHDRGKKSKFSQGVH